MELNNKPFLKLLNSYFVMNNIYDYDYREYITKIWVTFNEEYETILHIKTYRPGILIGKSGSLINSIQYFLQSSFGYPISIEVVEEDMWMGLYD